MANEKIVIEYGSKSAVLTIQEFDTEFDVNELLRIDYGNIMGEVLTFPLIFNRIANLKAEMDELVSKTKLDVDIFEAKLREEHRRSLQANAEKRVTDTEVETAVKLDSRFKTKKEHFFKVQKNYNYIESLYWSAQSKDTKLNRLSEKFIPGEFEKELVEGVINKVMIKFTKKAII